MLSPRRSAQLGLGLACLLLISSLGVLAAGASDGAKHLAKAAAPIPSAMMATTAAPHFALTDLDGRTVSDAALRGHTTVLYFTSVRCPTANRYARRFAELARQHGGDPRVQVLAVQTLPANSDVSLTEVRVQAKVSGWTCPTLMDRGATLAKAFGVTHTPTIVVLDPSGTVRYRGALDDDAAAGGGGATRPWATEAIHHVLAGGSVPVSSTPTVGCVIE
ncbi:MAG TPA: redoxin domain-containing protein [Tepidisphaeraceae bacterium]|nr:redoxin domain-containing protein [Tepidisphaeraceae bacterium]